MGWQGFQTHPWIQGMSWETKGYARVRKLLKERCVAEAAEEMKGPAHDSLKEKVERGLGFFNMLFEMWLILYELYDADTQDHSYEYSFFRDFCLDFQKLLHDKYGPHHPLYKLLVAIENLPWSDVRGSLEAGCLKLHHTFQAHLTPYVPSKWFLAWDEHRSESPRITEEDTDDTASSSAVEPTVVRSWAVDPRPTKLLDASEDIDSFGSVEAYLIQTAIELIAKEMEAASMGTWAGGV
jgi:hypothetical protein